MSDVIKSQLGYLDLLSRCNEKYRKAIISNADKGLITALCECVYNVLQGNIKVDEKTLQILHKYRLAIRKLCKKSCLKKKKKILVQKGGFLQYLLPLVLSTLPTLLQ